MADVVQIPPLQIVQGQDAFFNATFMEGSNPVDLTGWTGKIVLAHSLNARKFWESDVTLDAEGGVSVVIPADEHDAFCHHNLEDGPVTAGVFQITLTAPEPELNEIWQGNVAVTGVIL